MAKRAISVVFQAFTSKFEKKTKGAGKTLQTFAKKALVIGSAFLIAKKGVDAFGASLARIDKLAKTASALEVDPAFLTAFREASEDAGAGVGTADAALQQFAKTLGDAEQGFGKGRKGLEALGLTLEDLSGKNLEGKFRQVVDAISKMDNPAQKASAAVALFGAKGKELINVFNGGTGAIDEAAAAAERLGLALTDDELRAVEEVNDQLSTMGRTVDKVVDKIVASLAPAFREITLWINDKLIPALEAVGKIWLGIQGEIEKFFTQELFGGVGADIELGGERVKIDPFDQTTPVKDEKDEKIKPPKEVTIKSFTEAAAAGSSKAFDLLNPAKTIEIQSEQLTELKGINEGVQKVVMGTSGNHVQVSI